MRQILEEFNKLPEFRMPNSKGRKGFLREEQGTECAEIYSLPRVTQVVSEMGLRAAWSLDLTTMDPVDGMPLEFSFEAKRKRAAELLERDKPLLPCGLPNVQSLQLDPKLQLR